MADDLLWILRISRIAKAGHPIYSLIIVSVLRITHAISVLFWPDIYCYGVAGEHIDKERAECA
ncbi:hypothetical protein RC74_09830 [Falsihalocynthiibacter arcticus]|uniref:Uncharacterized protein n=1 Tax=Falsihalocynthiibacter arcticus TaxID=1579316 RepID=A0A126V1E7_9RHOB|nr:hypothetical protein RC74_09830 [Falsihalocynthiibacter arcticus]